MAGIIQDLYGNSGNRFKKTLAGIFNKNALPYFILGAFLLSVGDCEKANIEEVLNLKAKFHCSMVFFLSAE